MSDGDTQMMVDDFKLQMNRNLSQEALSDDEGKGSPAKSGGKKDLESANQFAHTTKKGMGSTEIAD